MFDIFKQTPPETPAAAPVQQQQAPAPGPATPGNIPENIDPNAQAPQPAPVEQPPESPLDAYKDMWETKPNTEDKPANTPTPLDAAALQQTFSKANFSNSITPETMAAIAAGGEGAEAAFATAMNQVAQQVMVQSTMVNNKLNEKAIEEALAKHTASLPEMLRTQAAADHLKTENPLFSNPAIKPVIDATQTALLRQFPNASHAEITKLTQDYIVAMGAEFAPKDVINDNSAGEVDWDKFMGS